MAVAVFGARIIVATVQNNHPHRRICTLVAFPENTSNMAGCEDLHLPKQSGDGGGVWCSHLRSHPSKQPLAPVVSGCFRGRSLRRTKLTCFREKLHGIMRPISVYIICIFLQTAFMERGRHSAFMFSDTRDEAREWDCIVFTEKTKIHKMVVGGGCR